DLAKRKLIPSMYNLVACGEGMMPPKSAVLGFARREMSLDDFRKSAHDWTARFSRLKVDEACWARFAGNLDYLSGLDRPDGFTKLKAKLEALEKARGLPPNRVYYLAIPPTAIGDSVERLAKAGLIYPPDAPHFSRVVVEKPIGHDLPSALEINRTMVKYLDESQIFRIDHYLGKETVQNLLALRFSNNIFERLWAPATSITCKSPWLRRKAWAAARCITIIRARCATWCRITSCKRSRYSRWKRRCRSTRRRYGTPSSTCCARCGRS